MRLWIEHETFRVEIVFFQLRQWCLSFLLAAVLVVDVVDVHVVVLLVVVGIIVFVNGAVFAVIVVVVSL